MKTNKLDWEDNILEGQNINWDEFEDKVEERRCKSLELKKKNNSLRKPSILYRGVSKASYKLQSSLERTTRGDQDLKITTFKDYNNALININKAVSSLTPHKYELDEFPEGKLKTIPINYEFMIYVRHHGFPSPLLDWTKAPYVAAFFALHKAKEEEDVAIYSCVDVGENTGLITGAEFVVLGAFVEAHKRHYQQRCQYTLSCVEIDNAKYYYCPYDELNIKKTHSLEKWILPAKHKEEVLLRLDLMNINAFTLFGTDESLLDMLALREIYQG